MLPLSVFCPRFKGNKIITFQTVSNNYYSRCTPVLKSRFAFDSLQSRETNKKMAIIELTEDLV